MKYRNIKSMLHNFAHSFCSFMNYWEDKFIVDELRKLLKESPDSLIVIQFPSGKVLGLREENSALKKSIEFSKKWLSEHSVRHQVDVQKLADIEMKIFPAETNSKTAVHGFDCDIQAKDDKGKMHKIRVNQKC